jgi:hypothetical protein
MTMGNVILFPVKTTPTLEQMKTVIEDKYGVSYWEYLAFTMGTAGDHTEAIARKMDRAMQKETLLVYTKSID